MRLPRWTTYPALALIGLLLATAVPQRGSSAHHEGAAQRARRAAEMRRAAAAAHQERVEIRTTAAPARAER